MHKYNYPIQKTVCRYHYFLQTYFQIDCIYYYFDLQQKSYKRQKFDMNDTFFIKKCLCKLVNYNFYQLLGIFILDIYFNIKPVFITASLYKTIIFIYYVLYNFCSIAMIYYISLRRFYCIIIYLKVFMYCIFYAKK